MSNALSVMPTRITRSGVHTVDLDGENAGLSLRMDLEAQISQGRLQVPPLSGTATELNSLASNPQATVDDALAIIEREPNLAARVMRLANSAMMRSLNPVTDLRRAVMRVGIGGVRDMAFALAMGQLCRTQTFRTRFGDAYKHSYAVACGTQWACQTLGLDRGLGFLCGLLHNLGVIAMLSTLGGTRQGAEAARNPSELQLVLDELHPLAGEAIIISWNLPPAVAEVARWHHAPEKRAGSPMLMLVAALVVAAEVPGTSAERAKAFGSMPMLFQAGLGRHQLAALAEVMVQAGQDELVKMLSA